jgi:LCP family protein required for cell wall assembly
MSRATRHPTFRLLVVIPIAGLTIAGLLSAAWLTIGAPRIAQGSTWFQVSKGGASSYDPSPDKPFFLLAIGNDNRDSCEDQGGLGDAIHVIGVNPTTHQASIVNIPRDTQAPSGDKINAYYGTQGLPGITAQIQRMTGVQIAYSITTNFCQFIRMIDEIGGVDVNVPAPMHDSDAGSNFDPGVVHLNGEQALSFSRDRKSFLRGDIDRTGSQATVLIAAIARLRVIAADPASTIKYAAAFARHVKTDDVSVLEMFRLGRLMASIDPAAVKSVTVPVGNGAAGTTNLALAGGSRELFADLADDAVLQAH